ncbi:MAG: hypothetical protein NUV37_00850 [Nanoarchaeota archaeon]|nr:hypothetical protein [Nanoarchaeota archaeon]
MRIKESKLFPHPVLREENQDYLTSKFDTIVNTKNLVTKYLIEIDVTLDNPELINLLKNKRAKIIAHLECSNTKFREIRDLNIGKNELLINAGLMEGTLYFLPLIVAKENIEGYFSKDFNKEYENNSFRLEKGDILAIGRHFPIVIENIKDKLASVPSIFSIKKSLNQVPRGIEIGLTKDKIEIYLPDNVFQVYSKYKKSKFYLDIMSSVIILPALMSVLDNLKDVGENGSVEYGDKRWFLVIRRKLKEEGIDLEKGELKTEDSFRLSQQILDFINARSLESLTKLESEAVEE